MTLPNYQSRICSSLLIPSICINVWYQIRSSCILNNLLPLSYAYASYTTLICYYLKAKVSKYILKRQFLIAETLSKDLKARRHYFQKWGYYKSSSIQEIAHAITQIEWVFQRRTNLIHRFLAGHHAARARKRCSIAKKKLAIFSFKKFC